MTYTLTAVFSMMLNYYLFFKVNGFHPKRRETNKRKSKLQSNMKCEDKVPTRKQKRSKLDGGGRDAKKRRRKF